MASTANSGTSAGISEEISHLPMTSPPLSFARARPGETDMGPDKPYARRFAKSNIQKLALVCCEKPLAVQGSQETISSRNWPDWTIYRVGVDSLRPQPRNERRKGHRGVHCIRAVSSGRKH